MDKTMHIYVGLSTNPATAHIGKHYLDVRDTTYAAEGQRGRQLKLIITNDPLDMIGKITAKGLETGVMVTYSED